MNIQFAPDNGPQRRVKIKVVGVGGAGGNAVDRMIENGLSEVDFYAVNTDGQALDRSRAHQTLVIGGELTRGLGAGGDPQIGRSAAEEDREVLAALVEDADMVFVTAGMGGGTGTGAAPVVAEVARAGGALTVAVVTRPFLFEGFRRLEQAEAGLAALREHVDALLVIPNERLMEIDLPDGGMTEVFRVADNVLYEATRGISDIIAQHAVVNLDFADVRTVMKDSGAAIMGTGRAAGEGRATAAAEQAINSPLLENVDIHGSRAVLVYLAAGNVGREDLRGAMGYIQQAAGAEAHVFFGFANDESLGDELQVTVIATGFPAGLAAPTATPAASAGADAAVASAAADASGSATAAATQSSAADDSQAAADASAATVPVPDDALDPTATSAPGPAPGEEPPAAPEPEIRPEAAGSPAAAASIAEQDGSAGAARPLVPGLGAPEPDAGLPASPAVPHEEQMAAHGYLATDEAPRPAMAVDAEQARASDPAPSAHAGEQRTDAAQGAVERDGEARAEAARAAGDLPWASTPPPPAAMTEPQTVRNLAALAAAAGGAKPTVAAHEGTAVGPFTPDQQAAPAPPPAASPSAREPSETSRRFLDPMGEVALEGASQGPAAPAGQRFRSSVLGDDKLRPAWERKYVD